MADYDESLLDFPCDYTIKVLGRQSEHLVEQVLGIIQGSSSRCGPAEVRPSKRGNFVSVNVTFLAESIEQLHTIHRELRGCDAVSLIL